MLTTWDGLLAAIIASPEDDALRLIAADWLDDPAESGERHDPARAEFIRVQVEIAKLRQGPAGPVGEDNSWLLEPRPYLNLRRRERELLGEACQHCDWHAPIPHGGWCWEFRRGFVESVTCSAADWLTHADTLVRTTPLREVTLTTWPEYEYGWRQASACLAGRSVYIGLRSQHRPTRGTFETLLRAEWPSVRTWNLPE